MEEREKVKHLEGMEGCIVEGSQPDQVLVGRCISTEGEAAEAEENDETIWL